MKTSQHGIDLIKKYEGFSSKVYLCPAGVPTIGYGHAIKWGEMLSEISPEEAEDLLRKDVVDAENAVLRLVSVSLFQCQFDALVSFTYNLGSEALRKSTLLKRLNAGQYLDAANEFNKWVNAGGKKLAGLVKRRAEERKMFLEGIV